MVKYRNQSPHSSVDRALPSGGKNPRSSRGGGILIFFLTVLLVSGCKAVPAQPILWTYSQLHLIDPSDTPQPEHDLIAVYSQTTSGYEDKKNTLIRLDFLSMSAQSDMNIFLAFDLFPGGDRSLPFPGAIAIGWEYLVEISGQGSLQLFKPGMLPDKDFSLSIHRNLEQQYVEIVLESQNPDIILPVSFNYQVFITSRTSKIVFDQSQWINSSSPPPQRIKTAFIFWNTYPAFTPAQALRRWDGAHTGPLGGRHGLFNLLKTAQSHHVRLILLDINNPFSLSALDYAGKLPTLRTLAAENLLLAPEYPTALSTHFFFPESTSVFLPDAHRDFNPNLCQKNPSLYILGTQEDGIDTAKSSGIFTRLGACKILWINPTISNPDLQPADSGLSLASLRQMVDEPDKLVLLGGSLPASTWGDPDIARKAFEYIHNHPWIQMVDLDQINSSSYSTAEDDLALLSQRSSNEMIQSQKLEIIEKTKNYAVRRIVREFFDDLTAPTFPSSPNLIELRLAYASFAPAFLALDEWFETPGQVNACRADYSGDEINDCILASEGDFLLIDPLRGSLLLFYSKDGKNLHQVVAPGFQLLSGVTDPGSWDLSKGIYAEGNKFFEGYSDGDSFSQITQEGNRLILSQGENRTIKSFEIKKNVLTISLTAPSPSPYQIPLVIDPWTRFQPDWADSYFAKISPESVSWGLRSKFQVNLQSNAPIQFDSFLDTQKRMDQTEDPNEGFPAGHYLPFPMALAQMNPAGDITVTLTIQSK